MSTIDELLPKEPVNILVEGDSGSGKTCLIGTLLRHDLEVGLIDADNGWSVLADPAIVSPDKRHLLSVIPLDANSADAYTKVRSALLNWPDNKWGPIGSWPARRVLVMDSLSFLTFNALQYQLKKANISAEDYTSPKGLATDDLISIFGGVAYMVRRLVYACCRAPCSFIATGHVRYWEKNGILQKAGFSTEGSRLMTELPKLFNNVWYLETERDKRFLYTQTKAGSKIQCKSENGTVIPPKIENPDLGELLLKLRNFQ
jgi:GTPase SAR1 family protein